MLERALGLGAPELVGRNIYFAEAIGFLANVGHVHSPFVGRRVNMRAGFSERPFEGQLWGLNARKRRGAGGSAAPIRGSGSRLRETIWRICAGGHCSIPNGARSP